MTIHQLLCQNTGLTGKISTKDRVIFLRFLTEELRLSFQLFHILFMGSLRIQQGLILYRCFFILLDRSCHLKNRFVGTQHSDIRVFQGVYLCFILFFLRLIQLQGCLCFIRFLAKLLGFLLGFLNDLIQAVEFDIAWKRLLCQIIFLLEFRNPFLFAKQLMQVITGLITLLGQFRNPAVCLVVMFIGLQNMFIFTDMFFDTGHPSIKLFKILGLLIQSVVILYNDLFCLGRGCLYINRISLGNQCLRISVVNAVFRTFETIYRTPDIMVMITDAVGQPVGFLFQCFLYFFIELRMKQLTEDKVALFC